MITDKVSIVYVARSGERIIGLTNQTEAKAQSLVTLLNRHAKYGEFLTEPCVTIS